MWTTRALSHLNFSIIFASVFKQDQFWSSVQKSMNQSTNCGRLRASGISLSRHVLEITRSWVDRRALQAWGSMLEGEVRMQSSMGNSTICSSCSSVCCFQTSSTTVKETEIKRLVQYLSNVFSDQSCTGHLLSCQILTDQRSLTSLGKKDGRCCSCI